MAIYSAATFRTVGSATTQQNLCSIFNNSSTHLIYIRRVVMQMDATAVLTSVMPLIKTSRINTLPTGGQPLIASQWDTSEPASSVNILKRQEVNIDGGSRIALVVTPGDVLWQQFGMRLHTGVGQVLGIDNNVVSAISETFPIILRQGEGIVVHIVAPAAASNPATNHYFVQCAWEEILI